jgi:hypothetical protein
MGVVPIQVTARISAFAALMPFQGKASKAFVFLAVACLKLWQQKEEPKGMQHLPFVDPQQHILSGFALRFEM